jgi:hypothetical protein
MSLAKQHEGVLKKDGYPDWKQAFGGFESRELNAMGNLFTILRLNDTVASASYSMKTSRFHC